ncbi:MAG: hypothetical protein D6732_00170 [Methanobacteriota archaeon]|nr:MAG: hypothetical protein D6732_00170 [Euryarchaeota archaeon]
MIVYSTNDKILRRSRKSKARRPRFYGICDEFKCIISNGKPSCPNVGDVYRMDGITKTVMAIKDGEVVFSNGGVYPRSVINKLKRGWYFSGNREVFQTLIKSAIEKNRSCYGDMRTVKPVEDE